MAESAPLDVRGVDTSTILIWLLVCVTIAADLWAAFLLSMLPLGVCDSIFDLLRAELRRLHGDEEAKRIAGGLCGDLGAMIRGAFFMAVVPLMLTNMAWSMLIVFGRPRAHPPAGRDRTRPHPR